ncbi:MAG: phosphoglycerate kinase [Candidatus Pacebacteria bacterium]|jgi:phosphoglycerate kinase|nr:phosphoglycerate kinase [Candidatus Paceibacterota bacterium]MDD5013137.1 phosphoglycerate kinase [Candidatus Paceibacterota bacterium]MDD5752906.1 phosphoglycerate kinase [Candidatus Paceibacterota bacterium]
MKNIKDFDIKGKRVLVRCDLNVPLTENGKVAEDFRIIQVLPLLNYLRSKGAKIVLISHLGDPKGKKDSKYSLRPVAERLWQLMGGVKFINETIGTKVEIQTNLLKEGEVAFLENLRFYKEEEENNLDFAKKLSRLGDFFVQEGFGVCHREHASVVGVPRYLISFPGFLLEREIKVLSWIMTTPERPFVSIVGGAKVLTKTRVIEKLLEKSDYVLVGGKIANSILTAKGICVRDHWSEEDIKLKEDLKNLKLTSPKLHLPIDGVISLSSLRENYLRIGGVGSLKRDEDIFDIGPETLEKYKAIISTAKTIIWNGPLGYFEKEEFREGTLGIIKAITSQDAFTVVGGGETTEIVIKEGSDDKFDHLSSGGGAMLDFIANNGLPGLKALD